MLVGISEAICVIFIFLLSFILFHSDIYLLSLIPIATKKD